MNGLDVRSEFVHVRGVTYYVERMGSGTPVLLLHGFTGSAHSWDHFAVRLAHSHEVVRLDILGHGRTDAPTAPDRYRMQEVTADVASVMLKLGYAQYACLGYSMGGRLALSLASARPEMVRALVLESASPGLRTEQEREARVAADAALAERIEQAGLTAFVDAWERIPLFSTQAELPDAVLAHQRKVRLSQRPQGLANSLRGMGTGSQPPLWDQLPHIDVPILLVTGALDQKFTLINEEMKRQLPNANHVVISAAGHTVHMEQPEAYTAAVLGFFQAYWMSIPD